MNIESGNGTEAMPDTVTAETEPAPAVDTARPYDTARTDDAAGTDDAARTHDIARTDDEDRTSDRDIAPAETGMQDPGELQRLREQWREAQGHFVDDPRAAVSQADELVEQALRRLTESYAQRRETIENGWSHGENIDTEALRQALRGYRDLFDQLVGTASGATNM